MEGLNLRGNYCLQIIRDGKVIAELEGHNDITNAGLGKILDVMFNGATQITAWYMGLVDNAGWTAFANTDTAAAHAGWTEFQTYDETDRPEWTAGNSSSQVTTNSAAVVFTIGGSGALKGIFIGSLSTKGGTTGTLWSTAAFALPVAVQDNDVLNLTYTVTAARA